MTIRLMPGESLCHYSLCFTGFSPDRWLPQDSSATRERFPMLVPPRLTGYAERVLLIAGSPPRFFGPMDVHTPHMTTLVILLTHSDPVKPVESRVCEIMEPARKNSHPSTFVQDADLSTEASRGQGVDMACPRTAGSEGCAVYRV